jgi:hypothetical protein
MSRGHWRCECLTTNPFFSYRKILGHLDRGSRSSIGEAEGQLLLAPLGVGDFEY